MLKQFGGFLGVGGARSAADSCLTQCGENSGVGSGGTELCTVPITWAERQTARLDFMDDVFIERIASDQSKQLAVSERFALFLSACERRTTAESEEDDQMPINGG